MDSSLDKKLLGFNKIAQEKLQNIFYQIPGKKDLIIEPALIKPLEHVCGVSWLRVKGVEKIYKFEQKLPPPPQQRQFIYLISSNLLLFKYVLDQIQSYQTSRALPSDRSITKDYHILLFPTVLKVFEHLIEEEGLHNIVSLHRFQWDFLTIDNCVLSLEISQIYRDVFVKQDCSLLGSIAHSLRLFFLVCKRPKIIFSHGEVSEKVMEMVNRIESYSRKARTEVQLDKDAGSANDINENSDFTAMLVIDRNKDYPSCLMTPVVYAGLLSELFQTHTGTITAGTDNNRIKTERLEFLELEHDKGRQTANTKTDIGTIKLNSNFDRIYSDHKYLHFSEAITNLSGQAKSLDVERNATKTMGIDEMKEFVQNKLQKVATQKKELFKHLILCETIMTEMGGIFEKIQDIQESMLNNRGRKQILNFIDELLSTGAHKYNVLRLIALFHVTVGGLTADECNNFIKNYCNAFGLKYLSVFSNLLSAKLFPDTLIPNKTNLLISSLNNLTTTSGIPIQLPTKWQNQFQMDIHKLRLLPQHDDSGGGGIHAGESNSMTASSSSLRKNPLCPSYVFNGLYIPLIAQLAHVLLKAENFDEINSKLGHMEQLKISGKLYSSTIHNNHQFLGIKEVLAGIRKSEYRDIFPLKPRTIFIFIVGGVTYAEIAACNLIEKLTSSKIVISSNCITSGSDIIQASF